MCAGLVLLGTAPAESLADQSPASVFPPTAATNVVATYDGGVITAGDLAEYADHPHFLADAEQNAPPSATGLDEKIARHLAALRILVNEAKKRGLDRPADPEAGQAGPQLQHHPFASAGPGWSLEKKLIEQRVLAQALTDELGRVVVISEQEFEDQYRTNRFKLLGFEAVEAGRIGVSARKHGDKALPRAKEALALIRQGQDFALVARQYSDFDPKLAEKHTYLPRFWGESADTTLAVLGEGKVSDPLPVEDGYELVKVERIHLYGNPSPEEARAQLRSLLTGVAAQERFDEMARAAEAAFPFVLAPSATNQRPAHPLISSNHVLLQCGQFTVSREELQGLALQRGARAMDDPQLVEIIRQESGHSIQMGELARSMGYDKRPDVQRALRYELDKQLAEKARRVLLPELAAEMTFPEERIREAYDTKFTATFPPQMEYDTLVVPMRFPPNATDEEREAVRTNALAKAEDIIRRAKDGAKLEEIAGGDSALQWMPGQSRVVNEGSALAPLVAGLEAGAVAAVPYEDFGGYCVIRVGKSEPRHKMPYEVARNYIIQDFRNEAVRDLHKDFETALLNKHHFAFGPTAAGRTRDVVPAAAANTKTQQ